MRNANMYNMNPFLIKTYKGPEYFFDRIEETKKLSDAIMNERNLTLFSNRRLGKTSLIQHVFSKLDTRKYHPIYIDLFATQNLAQFAQKVTEVVYKSKLIKENIFFRILGSIGASLSFDEHSGMPKIDLNIVNRQKIIKGLPELFEQLKNNKKHDIILAFDEFQELAGYEEEKAEAYVRTIMQDCPEITFIFSGSKKSLMKEMFASSNRPFFQSTQMMELHEIDKDTYAKEIFSVLNSHNKLYDKDVIYRILEETYCHTGFTQLVLSRVYSESGEKIDDTLFEMIWEDILEENRSISREQEFLLPKLQWKVLVAIAKEEFVKAPLSRGFADKYGLSASSSVARAVKALLDKGLIIECGDLGLRVYNVYILKNLQKLY